MNRANAHAHLIAMLLGNQLSLPVVEGRLGIGRWQSVLLVELDGPRRRDATWRWEHRHEIGVGAPDLRAPGPRLRFVAPLAARGVSPRHRQSPRIGIPPRCPAHG